MQSLPYFSTSGLTLMLGSSLAFPKLEMLSSATNISTAHASVHDGVRVSRARDAQFSFSHNSVKDLGKVLVGLNQGRGGLRSGQNS